MQTYPDLHRFIGYIRILLVIIFFLSGVLPVTLVHADDGDFVWAKAIGAEESDKGHGITVDTSGNVYTTGFFKGTIDFDPGTGTFNLTSVKDSDDIFIVLLSGPPSFPWSMFLPAIIRKTGP